jgi:hypothetical protein
MAHPHPTTAEPQHSAPHCPTCHGDHGVPTSVTVGHGSRTIELHCSDCGNDWTERTPNADDCLKGETVPD